MPRYNSELAEKATKLVVESLIFAAMDAGHAKRHDLHIVVGTSTGKILYELSLGKKKKWEYPYKKIARSKFKLTAKWQCSTRELQALYPEMAGEKGDTFYFGSWIDGDIVVSCSGVQGYWDEAFAKAIIAVIRAFITEKQELEMASGQDFR